MNHFSRTSPVNSWTPLDPGSRPWSSSSDASRGRRTPRPRPTHGGDLRLDPLEVSSHGPHGNHFRKKKRFSHPFFSLSPPKLFSDYGNHFRKLPMICFHHVDHRKSPSVSSPPAASCSARSASGLSGAPGSLQGCAQMFVGL